MTATGLTPSQTVGPYLGLLVRDELRSMTDPPGAPLPGGIALSGYVLDGAGEPMPDALIELWQADPDGRYRTGDGPGSPPGFTGFARLPTDADGRYAVELVKPGPVAGPQGGRQAPHVAVSLFARGLLGRLVTRIYFPDELEANAADPVLAAIEDPVRRATLVAQPQPDGLRFDIRLQGDGETVFFAV